MNSDQRAAYHTQQYNTRANAALAEATLANWSAQAALARRQLACVLDLPCGAGAAERVDFFPATQSGAPLLIFIHGGWWRFLNKSDFSWVARDFVKAGFNVAVTNYDLCPQVSVQTIVAQQLRAVAYLYRQADALEFDASKIHIAGHSAGGHLAAMMAIADWPMYQAGLPKTLIRSASLISGIYDLQPLTDVAAAQADLKLSPKDVVQLSPLTYRPSSIPTLAWAGGLESDEFKRQTQAIRQHWGKQVSGLAAAGLTHFSVVDDWAQTQGLAHQAALAMMRGA